MNRFLPLALLAPLLLATACGQESAVPEAEADQDWEGVELSALSWGLTWNRSGIEEEPDGAWTTTSDLGIEFRVERGWLSSYSAALAPCVPVEGSEQEWASHGILEQLLGIGLARADHSTEPDPSALAEPVLEDLRALEDLVLDELSFEAQTYCQAHYLVARADAGTPDPAADTPMSLVTLRLEGSWDAGEGPDALVVESAFNYGKLFDLVEPAGTAPPTSALVAIELERSLATLFDGVDPRSMNEQEVAWQVTRNLVEHTVTRIAWQDED